MAWARNARRMGGDVENSGDVSVNNGTGDTGYGNIRLDRTGQAEAFDAIGDRYDEAFPHKDGQLAAGEWLIGVAPAGSRVLDLGCGTGLPTARQLAGAGLRVTGVDLSAGMVRLARSYVPGAVLPPGGHRRSAAGGPVDLGRFDAVTAFFSLLMLPRAEIPLALRHHPPPAVARRAVRPVDGGGRRGRLLDPVPPLHHPGVRLSAGRSARGHRGGGLRDRRRVVLHLRPGDLGRPARGADLPPVPTGG